MGEAIAQYADMLGSRHRSGVLSTPRIPLLPTALRHWKFPKWISADRRSPLRA